MQAVALIAQENRSCSGRPCGNRDPHSGHDHSGPGGNPNPNGITQQQMRDGHGTWTINEADTYHQQGVDSRTPNQKWNDRLGHEEVFDHRGTPVRDHNGPTFNRYPGIPCSQILMASLP